jgi:uncharacterized membrane protein
MNDEYYKLFFIYLVGLTSIFFLVLLTYFISNKFSLKIGKKNSYYIFFFSLSFYFCSILYLSFNKINALHHYADFATHLEILWNNYRGLGLTTLMSEKYHGGSHWFAAHFTPIIYLTYVPAFSIFPSPYVLPISQAFFILSSLIPLWLISKKYLNENLSRLYISCFLFYPSIFYMNLYSIAYIEISIPLLLWLFYFLEKKNNLFFFIFLILSFMTREEVSLVTCFVGIYILFEKRYFLGFSTILLSLIYFYLVIFVIMPKFRIENYNQLHISFEIFRKVWVGDTILEIVKNIFFNPINSLQKIFTTYKITNLVMLLLPLLFLPLFSFLRFLMALPNLAIGFLSYSITHISFILYYVSPSIAVFFYSTIFGINRVSKYKSINQNALVNSILVGSISTSIFFGSTPISIAFWNKDYTVGIFYTTNFHHTRYHETDRHIAGKKIVQLIPENSVVSAEQHFLPLLYKHKKMIIFPSPESEIEYVLIDIYNPKKSGGYYDNSMRTNPKAEYQKYFDNKNWMIIKEDLGVTLFKKVN